MEVIVPVNTKTDGRPEMLSMTAEHRKRSSPEWDSCAPPVRRSLLSVKRAVSDTLEGA